MDMSRAYLCSTCDAMCSAAKKNEPMNSEAWCCNCGRNSVTYKALVVVDPDPALTRAVEAWRDVRADERREALEEIDTLIDIASMHALGVVLERTLRRAADLLRAAGGTP